MIITVPATRPICLISRHSPQLCYAMLRWLVDIIIWAAKKFYADFRTMMVKSDIIYMYVIRPRPISACRKVDILSIIARHTIVTSYMLTCTTSTRLINGPTHTRTHAHTHAHARVHTHTHTDTHTYMYVNMYIIVCSSLTKLAAYT